MKIIKVYDDGVLDGIAYEKSNRYVKARDESFFDMISRMPMNYIIMKRYLLSREEVSRFEDMQYNGRTNMDDLEFKVLDIPDDQGE